MKTMIWKEWRACWQALVGTLGLGAIMAYTLWDPANRGAMPNTLLSLRFQTITVTGFPLVAFVIGLFQVITENRRDKWAFLTHRPVSRTKIFFAKAIAGLSLYTVVAGVPYAACAVWAATPGHIAAPWDWRMLAPGMADWMTGMAYYFCGMLIAMRQARWYGGRLLPLVFLLAASFIVFHSWIHIALIMIIIITSVMAIAAWGVFITGGTYSPLHLVAKVALGTTVWAGVVILGMAGAAILIGLTNAAPRSYWSYSLDCDGRPVQCLYEQGDIQEIRDMQGNSITREKNGATKSLHEIQKKLLKISSVKFIGKISPIRQWLEYGWRRSDWIAQPPFMPGYMVSNWYYLPFKRIFVQYDLRSRRCMGALGLDGFVADPKSAQAFDAGSAYESWDSILLTSHAIYDVDLAAPKANRIFAPPEGQQVLGAARDNYERGRQPAIIVTVTDREIYYLTDDGQILCQTLPADDPSGHSTVSFSVLPDRSRFFLWYSPNYANPQRRTWMNLLIELNRDGTVVKRTEFSPIGLPPKVDWGKEFVTATILPPGLHTLAMAPFLRLNNVMLENPSLLISMISAALISAIAISIIARRYAFSGWRRWGWTVGGLLLGLPGLLTLIALEEWPARVPCPSCGKKRVVTRGACEHCAATFPAPSPNGTEIFDS
ncbi:MAG: ABC transporter permease [Candidatus Sumerlaeota bacterium]|nr:ABC transporter permease [Candidatus Sumerlaeota bacterium]